MSDRNIDTAQREYYARPDDERAPNFSAYLEQGQYRKDHGQDRANNAKELRIAVSPSGASLRLTSPKSRAIGHEGSSFTPWSFSQLARTLGAPAGYLKTLPPTIAADALNYGLDNTPHGSDLRTLVQLPETTHTDSGPKHSGLPIVRAVTSETYGRVWDVDLHKAAGRALRISDTPGPNDWRLPTAWDGKPAGAYASDRDSFLIAINGGSIVTDPTLRNSPGDGAAMYRGLMIRNSEVGAASIVIESVIFRFICGNLMLWGAAFDKQFRRRHVGHDAGRAAYRTIVDIAARFRDSSAQRDQDLIQTLITTELAKDRAGVIDELRKIGLTQQDAESAYITAEEVEHQNPRSFWGLAQGITRNSQASGHQDERYELDQLAAQLLKIGAGRARQLVTAH